MTLMETAQLLGNFGEFVGAFAVVGTLVYLAVQVGHSRKSLDENTLALEENRKLTRAEMLFQLSQRFDEIRYRSTENREIASIFVRGNENPSDLDDVDRKIFGDRMGPYFNTHLMFHRMVNDGFLEPEYLDFVDKDLRDNWGNTEGARTVWQEYMEMYPHRDHINSLLREAVSQG